MALTLAEKHELADLVQMALMAKRSKTYAVDHISKCGFKRRTVAAYWDIFSKNESSTDSIR